MTQPAREGFSLKPILEYGRKRSLELRRPDGRSVFALSFTWLAVLGVLALVTHLFIPAIIAAVALLLLKFEFVVKRTEA